jgi:hypothetical protein
MKNTKKQKVWGFMKNTGGGVICIFVRMGTFICTNPNHEL